MQNEYEFEDDSGFVSYAGSRPRTGVPVQYTTRSKTKKIFIFNRTWTCPLRPRSISDGFRVNPEASSQCSCANVCCATRCAHITSILSRTSVFARPECEGEQEFLRGYGVTRQDALRLRTEVNVGGISCTSTAMSERTRKQKSEIAHHLVLSYLFTQFFFTRKAVSCTKGRPI